MLLFKKLSGPYMAEMEKRGMNVSSRQGRGEKNTEREGGIKSQSVREKEREALCQVALKWTAALYTAAVNSPSLSTHTHTSVFLSL